MKLARCAVVLLIAVISTFAATPATSPITLAVDATDAAPNLFHAKLVIPVSPGPLTLLYPEWIPGEHAPSGPINDLAGLKFTGNGRFLKWRRDLLDNFTINVEVPTGVQEVHASLDYLASAAATTGYTAGSSATPKLSVISWNQVLLYPRGWTADQIMYSASLRIPAG